MNYYNKIKTKLINNEVFKYVKDYSINRNYLKTAYDIGEILSNKNMENNKNFSFELRKYASSLSHELSKEITYDDLKSMMTFYRAIMEGMTLNNHLTWYHYKEILKVKDPGSREYYINECIASELNSDELRRKINYDKNKVIDI